MRVAVRLLVAGAVVIAVACSGGSSGPPRLPPRASLNGVFQCYSSEAFYYKASTSSRRWRSGPSCANYVTFVAPTRADSIDTTSFQVLNTGVVRRAIEFTNGFLSYDSTSGRVTITYTDREPALYMAQGLFLKQDAYAIGTGTDGLTDSVRLVFLKVAQ